MRTSSGRWAVICWLLSVVFFGVSYVYAMQDSTLGWLIWFFIFIIWLYFAVNATVQYFYHANETRHEAKRD